MAVCVCALLVASVTAACVEQSHLSLDIFVKSDPLQAKILSLICHGERRGGGEGEEGRRGGEERRGGETGGEEMRGGEAAGEVNIASCTSAHRNPNNAIELVQTKTVHVL